MHVASFSSREGSSPLLCCDMEKGLASNAKVAPALGVSSEQMLGKTSASELVSCSKSALGPTSRNGRF